MEPPVYSLDIMHHVQFQFIGREYTKHYAEEILINGSFDAGKGGFIGIVFFSV